MVKRTIFIALFAVCSSMQLTVLGQKPVIIKLDNPSFEDYPQAGRQPAGWFDCGFAGETPPDVNPTGQFKVSKNAYHGSTYLGMVTRDNNTWEAVGQRLKSPLMKGITYTFSIYLARSEIYMSQSRLTNRDVNYVTPATLRVWAGSGYCAKEEMLGETEPVSAATWQKFSFKFTPKSNHNYFMIEAFYKVPTLFPYNGNVLADNASDLVPEIKNETVAKVDTKPKTNTTITTKPTDKSSVEQPKPPTIAIVKPTNNATFTAPSVELRALATNISDKSQISITFNGAELSEFGFDKTNRLVRVNLRLSEGNNMVTVNVKNKDGEDNTSIAVIYTPPVVATATPEKLREGSIIKIEKLQFEPNSAEIDKESFGALDDIYNLLAANPNMIVEIGGHTNLIIEEGLSYRLSTERAKAVADYLINKGIQKKRLISKGYGKSLPIENNTSQAANKVNQRVEIKILSTRG